MADKFVEAASFDTYPEGELYCTRLRQEGIPAIVTGANGASPFGTYFGSLGKVTVMVPAEYADRLPPPDEPSPSTGGSKPKAG